MKKQVTVIGSEQDAIRAGVISSLIIALCYIYATGISSLPRAGAFIVAFAVCFVLMMKSVVDLFVWAFGVAACCSGFTLGRSVRLFRRVVR